MSPRSIPRVAQAAPLLLSTLLAISAWSQDVREEPAGVQGITLDQALALLQRDDPRVAAAGADIEAARAARRQASRYPNPTLAVGAWNGNQKRWSAPEDQAFSYDIEVDQVFEPTGKHAWRAAGADFSLRSAQAEASETLRERELTLCLRFYQAVLARADARITEEDLAGIESLDVILRDRVRAGDGSAADLARFEIATIDYRQAAERERQDYRDAVIALTAAVQPAGYRDHPTASFEPRGDLEGDQASVTRDEMMLRARSRPDVLAAFQRSEAARASVRMSEDQRFPDLTLGVDAGRQGKDTSIGLVASFELPILDTYAAAEDTARARWRATCLRYDDALTTALAEADAAWSLSDSARAISALFTAETMAAARRAVDDAQAAYLGGTASMLSLLDAQRSCHHLRVAADRARFDLRMAIIRIEHLGAPAHASDPAADAPWPGQRNP